MKFKKLSYPYIFFMLIFIIIPIGLIFYYSITTGATKELLNPELTFQYFNKFFHSKYVLVLWNSIKLAFVATLICLVIGYPMAYWIAKTQIKYRNFLILLVMLPMWMNFLLRSYAWVNILSKNGILNTFLLSIGLSPIKLIYTETAVLIGMVYNFLPFMILPIYTVIEKIDKSIMEAAADLGANDFQTFWKILFPMSIPGVITGIMMVFIPAISTFEISALLGGNKFNLIGNVIEHQFRIVGDWHYGSAMSIVIIILISIATIITNKYSENDEKTGGGLW